MHHEYINVETNSYPRTHADIQQHYPNMSLAEDLSKHPPAPFEYVKPSERPVFDPILQQVQKAMPKKVEGEWTQQWVVIEIFDTDAKRQAALAANKFAKNENIKQEIVSKTQARLDEFAKTRNYFGILSACTYATSTNSTFAAEAQYCVEKRDATWTKIYQIEQEVEAGTRPMPAGYADIESELPALIWPTV